MTSLPGWRRNRRNALFATLTVCAPISLVTVTAFPMMFAFIELEPVLPETPSEAPIPPMPMLALP